MLDEKILLIYAPGFDPGLLEGLVHPLQLDQITISDALIAGQPHEALVDPAINAVVLGVGNGFEDLAHKLPQLKNSIGNSPLIVINLSGNGTEAIFRDAGADDYFDSKETLEEGLRSALQPLITSEPLEWTQFTESDQLPTLNEEIRLLKEYNKSILHTSGEGILLEDTDGRITFINPHLINLLNYSGPDLVDQHWEIIVSPDQRDIVRKLTSKRQDGVSEIYDTVLLTSTGERIPVRVSATPFTQSGSYAGTLARFTDIRNEQSIEKSLQRRDAILEAVAFAAERFIKTTDWYNVFPTVLQMLCLATEVHRGYLFENESKSAKPQFSQIRYEWTSEMVQPQIDNPRFQKLDFEAEGLRRWVRTLAMGEGLHGSVQDFPQSERAFLEFQDVYSIVLMPIFVESQWWGFIGLDVRGQERLWTVSELDALRVAANALGASIQRSRSDQLVIDSQQRYRDLTESTTDLIWEVDPDGVITYVNPKVKDLLGYSPDEVVGKKQFDLMAPDMAVLFAARFSAIKTEMSPFHTVENTYLHKNGRSVILESSGVPFFDNTGKLEGFRGIDRDITSRIEMEKALRAERNRAQRYLDVAEVILLGLDPAGNVMLINQKGTQILGVSEEDIIGENWFSTYLTEPDREIKRGQFIEAVQAGHGSDFFEEYVVLTPTVPRLINWHITFIKNEDGFAIGSLMSGEDITERRNAENSLRESELRFRNIFQSTPVSIWEGDFSAIRQFTHELKKRDIRDLRMYFDEHPEGVGDLTKTIRIVQANDATVEMFAASAQDEILGSIEKIILPESLLTYKEVILALAEGDRVFESQGILQKISGEPVHILHRIVFPASADDFHRVLVTMVDITRQKQDEISLQKQLGELTALHDVIAASVEASAVDELISSITKTIGDTFFPDHFGVLLLDEDLDILWVHSSYQGISDEEREQVFRVGEGVTGLVAATGKAKRVGDVRQEPSYIQPELRMRSELCVPLQIGEKVIGIINAESTILNAFSADDERLLISIAGYLASAIERLRASLSQHEQGSLAEALRDIASALNSTLDYEVVLDRILENIHRVVRHDSANILLLEGEHALVVRSRGKSERPSPADADQVVEFEIASSPHLQQMIEARIPVVIPDANAFPDSVLFRNSAWVRSVVSVPITRNGDILGLINLNSGERNFYSPIHADRLIALADQVSIALENARLFAETERRLREMEAISRISTTMRLSESPDILLDNLLAETLEIMGTDSGAIVIQDQIDDHQPNARLAGWLEENKGLILDPNEGISRLVYSTGKPVISSDFSTDMRLSAGMRVDIPGGWGGACIPMHVGLEPFGVLLVSIKVPRQLDVDEINILLTLAEIGGGAVHRARLHELTKQQVERLSGLRAIDRAITSTLDMRVSLNILLEQVISQLNVDASAVLLLNSHTQILEYVSGRGFQTNLIAKGMIRLGASFPGVVALERRPLIIPDLAESSENFVRSQLFEDEGFGAYFGFPLFAKGIVLGVLEVFNRTPLVPDTYWVEYLETLAGQAAIAVDNAILFRDLQYSNNELKLAYDSTLEGWARALEMRGMESKGHSQRLQALTIQLAQAMGIDEKDLVDIRRGAILHDIGKMGIPDRVLKKSGELTDSEWEILKEHPTFAYRLLSGIPYLLTALDIPYCHHEHWDGTGYPRGLKGEQIPIAARMFSVVDVWDSLLYETPYRPAWPRKNVVAHLREKSGSVFDPRVVQTFLELVGEVE